MKTTAVGAVIALLMPLAAEAHKGWIEPSKTVLAVGQWVTFDAATSTDPFIKDHNPLRLDNLLITAPDGSTVQPENAATGKLRSVFDLQLTQAGTYKIAVLNSGTMASWDDNGQTRRWPPRGQPFTAEGFAKEVPAKAKDLKVSQSIGRLETYVTAGKPSDGACKPSGKGLELVPVTAFNDLYAGEAAVFQLLIDGKPAKSVDVEVIADRRQYRDAVDAIELKSDDKGQLSIQWPSPGLYWLSASVTDSKADKPAKERRSSYTGIFEVLAP
ncbi:DUF4198 domain-containing protein [Hydrocarboniphaga sp.]|uniref:DUF4198 domain-containing protein n=1 Tax=Hydrocarboniphaga sp. TaxID=2033016 RepID=UPI00263524FC|nr:DUF4198 domain-containing protein [Hydrocarboniphaga sp.]